jgi:hypothetical protein
MNKFAPIPLYADEPTSDIVKGVLIRVLFEGIGYGISAHVMGKDFKKYAIYGGIWSIGSNILALWYTRHAMSKDASQSTT